MSQVTRGEIINQMVDELGIQSHTGVPVQVNEKVTPVFHLGRFSNVVKATNQTLTGDITVYTSPSDKDFYLQSVVLAYTKNAASDNVVVYCDAGVGGTQVVLCRLESQTLTAGSDHLELVLPMPLKLDRSSVIRLRGSFTVGAMTKSIGITGYLS
jgi:hypothetical protein